MMRKSLKIGLSVALGLTALPVCASAAEWWYVGETASSAYFVDRESITPVSLYGATFAKAWDTVSGAPAPGVFATKNVRYYNCTNRTIGLKNEFDFQKDGSAAGEHLIADGAFRWGPAAADSPEELLMDFVCAPERTEGDRPEFTTNKTETFFVDDIEKAKTVLAPVPGARRLSAKDRLGVGEASKPIF
jgi:hypothetical protein